MPDAQPNPNPNPTPGSQPTVASEAKKAIRSAAYDQLWQAVVTSRPDGKIQVNATLTGTAQDAAKTALMNQAYRKLCGAGYVVSLTCDSTAPGQATYYLDFNTEKGKERVVVGVAMDNDRATYLLNRAESFSQGILSKASGLFGN